uniref:Retinol dehydrogenase 14 n=1 Tax=Phallusia mammillata TaxID=59560 RepID=A0A6F9DRB0_9ASCI|nr:retinol dehydrogenase 14 [Phallusia mammillata]
MAGQTSVKNGKVDCDVRLDGKTVVITGANSGIGFETAKNLAKRGAKIVMACRDTKSAQEGKEKILAETPETIIEIFKLDLGSIASVREFAESFLQKEDRLDILINNAGVMYCPQGKTVDGFETHIGINHIGHFLLTNLLLDLLKKSSPSRIVVVSSVGYKRGEMKWDDMMNDKNYQPFPAYFDSKLANTLFAQELSRKLEGTGVTCNALHPGMVNTNLGRHMREENTSAIRRFFRNLIWPLLPLFFKTPEQGSQASIFCAIAPELQDVTGKYFSSNCAEEELLPKALNRDDAEKLWKMSEEWCGL